MKNTNPKKCKIYKTYTSILESVDTGGIIRASKTYVTLAATGVGLIVVPLAAGVLVLHL